MQAEGAGSMCLTCLRNSVLARMAGAEKGSGRRVRDELRKVEVSGR